MKHVNRPCSECPWKLDAEPGRFTEERWEALAATSRDDQGFGREVSDPMFACHKSPEGDERACAGWLAREGMTHARVRLDIALGGLPVEATQPGADWPDLHPDFAAARDHDLGLAPAGQPSNQGRVSQTGTEGASSAD